MVQTILTSDKPTPSILPMSHLSSTVTGHLRRPNENPVEAPAETPPADHELVLKVIPMPADANANGDIFGGWVMAQVDLAGAVLPARHGAGPHGHRGGQPVHLQAPGAAWATSCRFYAKRGRASAAPRITVERGACMPSASPTQGRLRQGDRGRA
jgi:hypothetical protein